MNGGQDLGGMMGFGPINPEIDEPFFHAHWEKRVLAVTLAMGGTGSWNIDDSRHMREKIDPASYLTLSYYEIWLEGLKKLLINHNLVTCEEISNGLSQQPSAPVKQVLMAPDVEAALGRGSNSSRPTEFVSGFQVGDLIRTRNLHPQGHTRLARYLRGHTGKIIEVHGYHVFPDSSAHGLDDASQWLYGVQFDAKELWGDQACEGDHVHADLWEPYFEQGEEFNS
jgi:nitrile hydratase beta subunit